MSAKDKGGNPIKPQDELKKHQEQKKQTRKFQPRIKKKKNILKKYLSLDLVPTITSINFTKRFSKEHWNIMVTLGNELNKDLILSLKNQIMQTMVAVIQQ